MGRLMAIDYGQKRAGIAITDPSQIIATKLTTIHVKDIFSFLENYFINEKVDCVVIGEPRKLNNRDSDAKKYIDPFVKKFKKKFPNIPVKRIDERFTSKIASQTILMSGLRKKARQNKELVDSVSAILILQSFLEQHNAL